MFVLIRSQAFDLKSRYRSDVHGDRKHATRSCIQRPELINAFFFRGDVFQISLLLLQPHEAELQILCELRPDAFAKSRQRQSLDIQSEGARQERITTEILAILLERDGPVLADDELIPILERFKFSGDPPKPWAQFLPAFQHIRTTLQRERTGRIASADFAERFAVFGAAFADRDHRDHQPHLFGEWEFGDGDVAFHWISVRSPTVREASLITQSESTQTRPSLQRRRLDHPATSH